MENSAKTLCDIQGPSTKFSIGEKLKEVKTMEEISM